MAENYNSKMTKEVPVGADTEMGLTPVQTYGEGITYTEGLAPTGTKRGLKSRHAQMIALGGTIGTGLFVGSGQALRIGGPVFFFLGYCLITIMVFGIVSSLSHHTLDVCN